MGADLSIPFSDRAMTLEESFQTKYSLFVNYVVSLVANTEIN